MSKGSGTSRTANISNSLSVTNVTSVSSQSDMNNYLKRIEDAISVQKVALSTYSDRLQSLIEKEHKAAGIPVEKSDGSDVVEFSKLSARELFDEDGDYTEVGRRYAAELGRLQNNAIIRAENSKEYQKIKQERKDMSARKRESTKFLYEAEGYLEKNKRTLKKYKNFSKAHSIVSDYFGKDND